MEIEIKSDRDLTTAERGQTDDCLRRAFRGLVDYHYQWSEADWHVMVRVDGALVSYLAIVERVGAVNGQPVKLGGIGGVATLPEWHGRGLASDAMEKATAFMDKKLGVEFGLLLVDEATEPFYRRLGWELVPGPLVFDQPGGKVTWHELTMVLPFGEREWPPGTIDLRGLPW
jgi:ribosomal protein S18 acetylase RimI-like enzyme